MAELPMFIMAILGGVLIWKHGRQGRMGRGARTWRGALAWLFPVNTHTARYSA